MNGNPSADTGTTRLTRGRLVYRFTEAGYLLGGLTRKTIKKLVDQGDLETTTVGAYPMVTHASIEAYIERNKRRSVAA
jgi:hypothetical protein